MAEPLFTTEIGDVRIEIVEAGTNGMKLEFHLLDRSQVRQYPLGDTGAIDFTPITGTMGLTAGDRASVAHVASKLRALADAMEQHAKACER